MGGIVQAVEGIATLIAALVAMISFVTAYISAARVIFALGREVENELRLEGNELDRHERSRKRGAKYGAVLLSNTKHQRHIKRFTCGFYLFVGCLAVILILNGPGGKSLPRNSHQSNQTDTSDESH
jgi:hypothetical protein